MPRTMQHPTTWIPELNNPAIVYLLLALGTLGTLAELTSTTFIPRLVLYVLALSAGLVGLHRRRAALRRA